MPKDSSQNVPESPADLDGPVTPTEKDTAAKTPAAKAKAKTKAKASEAPEAPEAPESPEAPRSSVVPVVVPPISTPPGNVPPVVPKAVVPPSPPAAWTATPPPIYSPGEPSPYATGAAPSTTTLSLLAMIFGIVGLVLSCCYGAGFLFGAAGIVLGHLGRKRESAKGMALAGLITGYASVALSVVMWILLFLLALSPLFILPFLPLTNGY